jgi:hypothetical protein
MEVLAALLGLGGIWLLFVFAMFLAAGAFWLWMLIDVLTKQNEDKVVWVLVVFFLNLLGAMIYYFVVRKKRIGEEAARLRPAPRL